METIRETLTRLRRTPAHFERSAAGLTEAQLREAPAAREWSVVELLAHVKGAADVQGGWIARILAEDTPSIRYYSPRTGMNKTGYATATFAEMLRTFTAQRRALVRTLTELPAPDWSRCATFTGTKPGWEQTVLDVAHGIANHEHAHFAQITSTAEVARQS